MILDRDIFWAAGIIEGEGCLAAQRDYRYKNIYSFRITVGSTDKDTIVKLASILKVPDRIYTVKEKNRLCKTMYQTRVYGSLAIQWMMTIYPIMSNRRKEKIKEILTIWKNHA